MLRKPSRHRENVKPFLGDFWARRGRRTLGHSVTGYLFRGCTKSRVAGVQHTVSTVVGDCAFNATASGSNRAMFSARGSM